MIQFQVFLVIIFFSLNIGYTKHNINVDVTQATKVPGYSRSVHSVVLLPLPYTSTNTMPIGSNIMPKI